MNLIVADEDHDVRVNLIVADDVRVNLIVAKRADRGRMSA